MTVFIHDSFSDVNRPDSKLRTCKRLKTKSGFENYLNIITSQKDRIALTKLRPSNHQFMIEKSRHDKIRKDMRFCPFCRNQVDGRRNTLSNAM